MQCSPQLQTIAGGGQRKGQELSRAAWPRRTGRLAARLAASGLPCAVIRPSTAQPCQFGRSLTPNCSLPRLQGIVHPKPATCPAQPTLASHGAPCASTRARSCGQHSPLPPRSYTSTKHAQSAECERTLRLDARLLFWHAGRLVVAGQADGAPVPAQHLGVRRWGVDGCEVAPVQLAGRGRSSGGHTAGTSPHWCPDLTPDTHRAAVAGVRHVYGAADAQRAHRRGAVALAPGQAGVPGRRGSR